MKNPFDSNLHPFCFKGHEYAQDVIDGKIVSCIYLRGACERYMRDMDDSIYKEFYFDKDAAEKFLRVVQKFEHVIGEWKSSKILFEPWQCWVWMNIMGFKSKSTGYRRFRVAHIEVARGNAKSTMASQAALYFMALDNPKGNQVATAATKKEQARIVFDAARAMALKNNSFLKATGVRVLQHSIIQDTTNSKIRPLASDSTGLDGLNDVLAVLDELHAMKRETYDVIVSGMAKRKDSLVLCITTAGFNTEGVGHDQSNYAKAIATNDFQDDSFFAAVYTLDVKDNVFDERNWPKANPNWDASIDQEKFRSNAEKAARVPADKPNFMVKHLDLWLSEARAFFDMRKFDECADTTLKIEDFKGERCRIGLDLAAKVDLAGYVMLFKKNGIYYAFEKAYLPEERVKELNNTLFTNAVGRGQLIAMPGEVINNDVIRTDIVKDIETVKAVACGYDAWNATEISQKLSKHVEMIEMRMNVATLSEPMKKLDALIREGKFRHSGSPLFRWNFANVVAKEDPNGNVFPRKSSSKLKIDLAVATIMSLALWIAEGEQTSRYESKGIRFL